jgi:hypothetical protein
MILQCVLLAILATVLLIVGCRRAGDAATRAPHEIVRDEVSSSPPITSQISVELYDSGRRIDHVILANDRAPYADAESYLANILTISGKVDFASYAPSLVLSRGNVEINILSTMVVVSTRNSFNGVWRQRSRVKTSMDAAVEELLRQYVVQERSHCGKTPDG